MSYMNWKITATKYLNPFGLVIQAVHIKYMSFNRCSPNYNVIPASDAKFQLDCDLWIPSNLAAFAQNAGISR